VRSQGSHSRRPDVSAGEVLCLQFHPRRLALYGHHLRRLRRGIRSVRSGFRRKVLAAEPARRRQRLGRHEIARVISDNHGEYNGLTYSTFAVNPPDPSGYIPNMLSMCMNDRGTGTDPDPFYQANYSQFCYTWSFMPGETAYLDTPVIPTSAFAAEYNHPDCAYPDTTPAIASVTGSDGVAGPWVSALVPRTSSPSPLWASSR